MSGRHRSRRRGAPAGRADADSLSVRAGVVARRAFDRLLGDLARAARVTTGALYQHFPTKGPHFERFSDHAPNQLMAVSMAAAQEANRRPRRRLGKGLRAFLRRPLLETGIATLLRLILDRTRGDWEPARYTEPRRALTHALCIVRGTSRRDTRPATYKSTIPEDASPGLALRRGNVRLWRSAEGSRC